MRIFQVARISWDCFNYSSTRNNCPITSLTFAFPALCFPNSVPDFENVALITLEM